MAAEPVPGPNIVEIDFRQNSVSVLPRANVIEILEATGRSVVDPRQEPTIVEVLQNLTTVEVDQGQNVVEVYTTVGLRGVPGPVGPQGADGYVGVDGPPGPPGPVGPQGHVGRYTTSPTPPVDPDLGDAWYSTVSGKTYVYYDDYWVESGSNARGDAGPPGEQGPPGSAGRSINVRMATVPPTPSDAGAEGDLWVVT